MLILLILDTERGHMSLRKLCFLCAHKKQMPSEKSATAALTLRSPLRSEAEWNRPPVMQSWGEEGWWQWGSATIKAKMLFWCANTTGQGGSGAGSILSESLVSRKFTPQCSFQHSPHPHRGPGQRVQSWSGLLRRIIPWVRRRRRRDALESVDAVGAGGWVGQLSWANCFGIAFSYVLATTA